jgi:hypothetical protein
MTHLLSAQWWSNRYDQARRSGELARLERLTVWVVLALMGTLLVMQVIRCAVQRVMEV